MGISMDSTTLDISSQLSVDIDTTSFSVDATLAIKLKGLQIAIGSDAVELLSLISDIIDALGSVSPISPVGPCTPLQATPQWLRVISANIKLASITGS